MKRTLVAIPIGVGSVGACTLGALLIMAGLQGLLATSLILRND